MLEDEDLFLDFRMWSANVSYFHYQRLREKKVLFAERMIDTENAQAADLCDKIHSVLLASDFEESPSGPDYTLAIQELLMQTTMILLRGHWSGIYYTYPLDYMRDEDYPRVKKISNLPSWVPDMTPI